MSRALAGALAIHALVAALFGATSALRARARLGKKAQVARAVDDVPFDVAATRFTSSSAPELVTSLSSGSAATLSSDAYGYTASARDLREPTEARRTPRHAKPPPEAARPFAGITKTAATGEPVSIGLELGAPNRFATSDALGQREADQKRFAASSLSTPDTSRGAETPVLRALCDATSASTAPLRGRAVFRAVADAMGVVVGLDIVDCDGARSGWAHAAELARASLTGKKLDMPKNATRAEMRVEIISSLKLPTGHDTGTNVSIFGVRTSKGDGRSSPTVRVLDVLPKFQVVELSKELKVPVVTYDPDVIRVNGDAANAGATPRRVVRAKLLDAKVM